MDTLQQIQAKLKNIMLTSNMESPELDALNLLLSNAIYINQAKVTSAVVEMSPSKCIQLNSAIVHARDKDYSVFRGKNPHFIIKNSYVTKIHDMSKYAIFAETNNYKLVLAQDYSNYSNDLSGNQINSLEVILTRDVLTESFTAEGLYSHHLSGTGISEDISLFKSVGDTTSKWEELDLVRSIEDVGTVIEGREPSIAVITDTDYSAALYNVTKFKSDYAYICKYLPLITNDIGDTKEIMSKFKSFNGFAIKGPEMIYEAVDDTGIGTRTKLDDYFDTKYNYVSPRETDKDNIYLNSIHAFTTLRTIRTENDLEYLFKIYFGNRASGVKCILKEVTSDNSTITQAKVYYMVNKLDSDLNYSDFSGPEKDAFISYLRNAHYLNDKSFSFTASDMERVSPMDIDSLISEPSITNICGIIKVHATKDVLSEVASVGNKYLMTHYNTIEGEKFCPIEWLAEMQKVDGVRYIEFTNGSSLSDILSNKVYNDQVGKWIRDYEIDNNIVFDRTVNRGFHIELYKEVN